MDVVWTTPALDDLDRIQDFVAVDSPAAALRLARDIYERTNDLLSATPMSGRAGRDPRTREIVLSKTPYIVVYRLSERAEILAVVHGAREWPERFDR